MKATVVVNNQTVKTIDWGKRQIVKSEEGSIILTTGKHTDNLFAGTVLGASMNAIGVYGEDFYKSQFTPCTSPITITFEND